MGGRLLFQQQKGKCSCRLKFLLNNTEKYCIISFVLQIKEVDESWWAHWSSKPVGYSINVEK